MRIDLETVGIRLSNHSKRLFTEQIERIFSQFSKRIRHIRVVAREVNSSRDGLDKELLLRAKLQDGREFIIRTTERNLVRGLGKGAERLIRVIREHANRAVSKRRRASRYAATALMN